MRTHTSMPPWIMHDHCEDGAPPLAGGEYEACLAAGPPLGMGTTVLKTHLPDRQT